MNRINLIGRITKDLETRTNEAGNTKCQFSLAVPRIGAKEGMQDVDFFNITVWNKQAENLAKYQKKGSLIAVEGELRADQYTDKDENDRIYNYVLAQRIEYLSSSNKEEKGETKQVEEVEPFNDFSGDIELTDEDLPF